MEIGLFLCSSSWLSPFVAHCFTMWNYALFKFFCEALPALYRAKEYAASSKHCVRLLIFNMLFSMLLQIPIWMDSNGMARKESGKKDWWNYGVMALIRLLRMQKFNCSRTIVMSYAQVCFVNAIYKLCSWVSFVTWSFRTFLTKYIAFCHKLY